MDIHGIFGQLAILLAVVALITASFRQVGINPIIGLFAAGVVLGPHGFALIEKTGSVDFLSELGIMFLLFVVGLELSFNRIKAMARYIFGLGMAHFLLSSAALAGALMFFGQPVEVAVVLGIALAMSSTAFLVQLFSERETLNTSNGRRCFSVLLFQDMMVGPILALIPLFAIKSISASGANSSESHGAGAAEVAGHATHTPSVGLLVAALTMIVAFIVAKLVLEQIMSAVRDSAKREAFPAAIVLAAISMGWISSTLGMSVSLGAFLAGLALSSATWRHEVKQIVEPFESTLLAFFFIAIGSLIPVSGTPTDLARLAGAALMIITIKTLAGFLAGAINRLDLRNALQSGLCLAQGGEFAFVVVGVGMAAGIIDKATTEFWMGATAISMALSPLLVTAAERIEKIDHPEKSDHPDEEIAEDEIRAPDPMAEPVVHMGG